MGLQPVHSRRAFRLQTDRARGIRGSVQSGGTLGTGSILERPFLRQFGLPRPKEIETAADHVSRVARSNQQARSANLCCTHACKQLLRATISVFFGRNLFLRFFYLRHTLHELAVMKVCIGRSLIAINKNPSQSLFPCCSLPKRSAIPVIAAGVPEVAQRSLLKPAGIINKRITLSSRL